MHNNEDAFLEKILLNLDFSKQLSPGHKERLRRELFEQSRELSEDELKTVCAAGTLFAADNQLTKETDVRRKTKDL